jgi:predicted alpha/beta hydrolase
VNEGFDAEASHSQANAQRGGKPTDGLLACASGNAENRHVWSLMTRIPARPRASLLWVPALGIAAKHYARFADALAAHGVAVFVHEWRGHGSSALRAGPHVDWGYRELLMHDLPASDAAMRNALPGLPALFGGHSLGGQLAACHLGLSASMADALWLVASGSPYWRVFPAPRGWALPWAYRFLPWLADRFGALPGRRIGFGGREARGVMRDWTRTGLSGRYGGLGIAHDIDAALAGVRTRIHGVRMRDDWLVSQASLDFLLAKMPQSRAHTKLLDRAALGVRADHFGWIRRPQAVADALAASLL